MIANHKIHMMWLPLVLLLAAIPLFATTVPKIELPEMVFKADAIIDGHVDSIYSEWDAEKKLIFTYISVRIDESLKGGSSRSLLIKQLGGRVGGLDMNVAGMPLFSEGEQVLLFLRQQTGSTYEVVGLNQGRYQIIQNVAVAHVSGVDLVDPKTGQIVQAGFVDRVPLADFKAKIRELMK